MYEASSLGRIRSHSRKKRGALLNQPIGKKGYPHCNLKNDQGELVHGHAHSFIALAFLGPLPHNAEVCHWDGDKTNNRIENLRYGTHAENGMDTRRLNGNSDREADKIQKAWLWRAIIRKAVAIYKSGKMNLKQVGDLIGVTESGMSLYVSGKRDPKKFQPQKTIGHRDS